jgi:hypothetical protein
MFGRRVIDGARTRDPKDHNLVLCQLSYDHRLGELRLDINNIGWSIKVENRPNS